MVVKFKNEVYAVDDDGEVYLVDSVGNVLSKKALRKSKLVHGVGANDWKYAVWGSEGGFAPVYDTWYQMLRRGYSEKCKSRQPTYTDVSVSKEWLSFTNFFNDTKKYMKKGYELDKDLLFYGNKQYSKGACIFVPVWLNLLLNDHARARGNSPQGTCLHKETGKFRALCAVDGKQEYIGLFDNVNEASNAYIEFKINYIESKRLEIEHVALHNDLHLRFSDEFSLTDLVIDNFKKQTSFRK